MPEIVIGNKFGRITVISFYKSINQSKTWNCICECGTQIKKTTKQLNSGNSNSCGCLQREILIARNKNKSTHGLSEHPIYSIWSAMMNRCYNNKDKRYKDYGGRGIYVCKRWHSVKLFYEDMILTYKSGLSLDRKNNDGIYKKSNCRWVITDIQNRNKRTNVYISHNGEKKILTDWANHFGIHPSVFGSRIRRGWSFEKAITNEKYVSNQFIERRIKT